MGQGFGNYELETEFTILNGKAHLKKMLIQPFKVSFVDKSLDDFIQNSQFDLKGGENLVWNNVNESKLSQYFEKKIEPVRSNNSSTVNPGPQKKGKRWNNVVRRDCDFH